MFNVDGKEFIFLVLIALVVLGPEKLPDAFRRAGRAYSEFRRISETFQSEFRKVIDEPTAEFRATTDAIRESFDLRTTTTTNPDGSVTETDDGEFTAEEIERITEVDMPTFAADTASHNGDSPSGSDQSGESSDASEPDGPETHTDESGTDESDTVGTNPDGVTGSDHGDGAGRSADEAESAAAHQNATDPRPSQPARLGRNDAATDEEVTE